MPNWNSNGVTISAPLHEVNKYLVYNEGKSCAKFNMHKLFPEAFDETDPTGREGWDFDWACDNT